MPSNIWACIESSQGKEKVLRNTIVIDRQVHKNTQGQSGELGSADRQEPIKSNRNDTA